MHKAKQDRIYFTDAEETFDLDCVETLAIVGQIKNNGNFVRKIKLAGKYKAEEQKKRYNNYLYFFVTRDELEDFYGKWLEVDFDKI